MAKKIGLGTCPDARHEVRQKVSREIRGGPRPQTRDRVTVTNETLLTPVGVTAHEVTGVIMMVLANPREGNQGVHGAQRETAAVDCDVAVAYGVNIPAVAESVRERVLYAANMFAGTVVTQVGVYSVGVRRAGR